jgi:hypothetical protein
VCSRCCDSGLLKKTSSFWQPSVRFSCSSFHPSTPLTVVSKNLLPCQKVFYLVFNRGLLAFPDVCIPDMMRVPGPMWLFLWFGLNVTLTLTNKSIFQFGKFGHPLTLTAVHYGCTSVGALVACSLLQVVSTR